MAASPTRPTTRSWGPTASHIASNGGLLGLSNNATVTITVTNDAPGRACRIRISAVADVEKSVGAPGVLGNDDDADGDDMTVDVVQEPAHGNLNEDDDGSFRYKADDDFAGTDTWRYRVSDGFAWSNTVTVTMTVSGPPATPAPTPTPDTGTHATTDTTTERPADSRRSRHCRPSRRCRRSGQGPRPVRRRDRRPLHRNGRRRRHRLHHLLRRPRALPPGRSGRPVGQPRDRIRAAHRRPRLASAIPAEARSTLPSIGDDAQLDFDTGAVAFGSFEWAVPALVLTVPGILIVIAVLVQTLIGLAWLPVARRWLGGDRRRRTATARRVRASPRRSTSAPSVRTPTTSSAARARAGRPGPAIRSRPTGRSRDRAAPAAADRPPARASG